MSSRLSSRLRAKMVATAGGYFWLPCDVCGMEFGGHEEGGGYLLLDAVRSRVTCPRCPGQWVRDADGIVAQAEVRLDGDGRLQPMLTYSRGRIGSWGEAERLLHVLERLPGTSTADDR